MQRITLILLFLLGLHLTHMQAQSLGAWWGNRSPELQSRMQLQAKLPWKVLLNPDVYGYTEVQQNRAWSEIRTTQQPASTVHTNLYSEGQKQFGRFYLQGSFEYRNEEEQEIGWKLGRDVFRQPYYYGNIRPGDWSNDRYRLNMNMASKLFNERLWLAFGADYQVERLARYNDPRPLINHYALITKLQLAWEWKRGHTISAYLNAGDIDEDGAVQNYNDSNDSFGQTEFNLITITGLGSYTLQRRSQYEKPTRLQDIGMGYYWLGKAQSFTIEAGFKQQDYDFLRRSGGGGSASFEQMGTHFMDIWHVQLFGDYPLMNGRFHWQSQTIYSTSNDFNNSFNGANYFNNEWAQHVLLRWFKSENAAWQYLIKAHNLDIQDRNASHQYAATRIKSNVSHRRSWKVGPHTRLSIIPSFGLDLAIDHQLRVGNGRENLMTDYLLYSDVYNLSSSFIDAGLSVQFFSKLQNLSFAVQLEGVRTQRRSSEQLDARSAFNPGDLNHFLMLRVQFFH